MLKTFEKASGKPKKVCQQKVRKETMTINLNKVAAKREKPKHASRGQVHAGMIGSSQRIPSGPVAMPVFRPRPTQPAFAFGLRRGKTGRTHDRTICSGPCRQKILDSQKPSTHDVKC
jgi:hypothetical protein